MRSATLEIWQTIPQHVKASDACDHDLVVRAQCGDREAFNGLVRRYHVRIFNTVYALVGDRDDADDLAQEIFLKAYRSLPSFRGKSQFYTWLYRIGINCWKDWLKSPKQRTGMWESVETCEDYVLQCSDQEAADARVENGEFRSLLERALADLPAEQRAAVVLREIDGLDYEEIAQALRCSLGTVKSRLCRARMRLKELWETRYRGQWDGKQ